MEDKGKNLYRLIDQYFKNFSTMKRIAGFMTMVMLLLFSVVGNAQNELFVNMAFLDGIAITPENLLNFQVQSNKAKSTHALVTGSIRYRNSTMRISYKFEYNLQPGLNNILAAGIKPTMQYSDPALKSLFEQYKMLPQGIYEYCIGVTPDYSSGESNPDTYDECIYHKSEDIFLINLIDPENDAKIYEYNPMLSWTVNYPFASELKYRLRVAEIKKGQNTTVAINRNNPVYDEKNLMQMSQVYPVYAKPLQLNQPYAWTVDAYYKGILLGGAEAWKFTIIEDSLLVAVNTNPSYVDVQREQGIYTMYAPGLLKLKYDLKDLKADSLQIGLLDGEGRAVKINERLSTLNAKYGDNRFIINFHEEQPLTHLKQYTLTITSQTGKIYKISFKYVNPELIRK
jgi:hypothetical protein